MNYLSVLGAVAMGAGVGLAGSAIASPTTGELDQQIRRLNRQHKSMVETSTIGKSREGRAIHLIRLADEDARGGPGPEDRPALLVVAGINGDHLVGTDVAMGLALKLLEEHADELKATTVYIVPRLNPDGAAVHLEGDGVARSFAGSTTPTDDDHDGRVDEDGPNDVNGDGVITMIRVKNPPENLKAEYVIDTDEPRLMRAPKPEAGERAEYALLIESVDDDGDGLFAEDGPGGVEIDKNFPHLWPEHKAGAGEYQLSEAESGALARWMLSRPNIAAVLTFGPHDSLAKTPTAGKMDVTGEAPTGIEKGDKAFYDTIGEVFKKMTKMTSAPSGDNKGAFSSWAYGQYGAPTFATPVWVRPDTLKKEGKDGDKAGGGDSGGGAEKKEEAPGGVSAAKIQEMVSEFQSASGPARQALMQKLRAMGPEVRKRVFAVFQGQPDPGAAGSGAKKSSKADANDIKWLKYSDDDRDGAGFIKWTPFEHPQLGAVEIGGFVPGFKMTPPVEELDRLVGEQTEFAADLMGRLPRLSVEEPSVQRVGPGVWRVSLEVVNQGYFPTMLAIAKKVRRVSGTAMVMELPADAILAGEPLQITRGIDGSGGTAKGEWLISGVEGAKATVVVRSPTLGERRVQVTLQDN